MRILGKAQTTRGGKFYTGGKEEVPKARFRWVREQIKEIQDLEDVLSLSWLWGKTEFQRLESARKGSI